MVPLFFPPAVEVPRRDHIGRDAGIVKIVDLVIAHKEIAPTSPLFHLGDFRPKPGVIGEEPVAGLPLAVDERMPDEQFPGRRRIYRRIGDPAPRNQRQAVQGDPFIGQHRTTLRVPVRLAVAARNQVPGDPFDTLGLDAGGRSAVEPTGLHQISDHDPAWRALCQHRTGSKDELGVAGPGVFA